MSNINKVTDLILSFEDSNVQLAFKLAKSQNLNIENILSIVQAGLLRKIMRFFDDIKNNEIVQKAIKDKKSTIPVGMVSSINILNCTITVSVISVFNFRAGQGVGFRGRIRHFTPSGYVTGQDLHPIRTVRSIDLTKITKASISEFINHVKHNNNL